MCISVRAWCSSYFLTTRCRTGSVIIVWHCVSVVSTVASQYEESGSEPDCCLGSFCIELKSSPCDCVGFIQALQFCPAVQRHAIWHIIKIYDCAELPISMNSQPLFVFIIRTTCKALYTIEGNIKEQFSIYNWKKKNPNPKLNMGDKEQDTSHAA